MRPIAWPGIESQENVGGKQAAEEHYFRGEKKPDPDLGVPKSSVATCAYSVGNLHILSAQNWFPGWMRRCHLTRLDRLVLHGEIFSTPRQAVFVGPAISHRRLDEIAVPGRRGRCPFQCRRIPGIVVLDLPSLPDAVEEINDERNLRQAHDPRRNRNGRIPLEPG